MTSFPGKATRNADQLALMFMNASASREKPRIRRRIQLSPNGAVLATLSGYADSFGYRFVVGRHLRCL